MRRQLLTGLRMTVVLTILLGLVYPLVMTAAGQVLFPRQANGSMVKDAKGRVVGSSLLGQLFTDAKGNAVAKYFQPRPSAAGDGYDPTSSSATNLGPSNPNLIGNQDGTNPYATKADPYCVPVQATDKAGNDVTDKKGNPVYVKNADGSYQCDPSTVGQRVLAYRALNGLTAGTKVPVDAVTASGSGLDPDISVANALLQAPRVAKARNLPLSDVVKLIHSHIRERAWGFLGERTVNVLDLNLALDKR